jgi:hypothetical protein
VWRIEVKSWKKMGLFSNEKEEEGKKSVRFFYGFL